MADLSSLQGVTFSPDDYGNALIFVGFNGDGTVTASLESSADAASAGDGDPTSAVVTAVDPSAPTSFGLGTVTFNEVVGGQVVDSHTADVLGVAGGQVLLGLDIGDDATNESSDPYNGNYVILSDTSLDATDNGGSTPVLTFSYPGSFIPCFAAGTIIATPGGDVRVEDIRAGDHVLTISGQARAVVWTGSRIIDVARHPRPETVRPIRIEAGAFADQVPCRDLLLSPDHSIHADGVLIPAKYLLNGLTITQLDQPSVAYHHIELESHDVVLANGLPAETYLDTGNRTNFASQRDPVYVPHPDFASACDTSFFLWESLGYAPIVLTGPELDIVRSRLERRATRRPAARDAA